MNKNNTPDSSCDYLDISTLEVGETQEVKVSAYASTGEAMDRPYCVINATDGKDHTFALAEFDPSSGEFHNLFLGAGFTEVAAPRAELMPYGIYRITWSVRWTQPFPARTRITHTCQFLNEANRRTRTGDRQSGVHLFGQRIEAAPFSERNASSSGASSSVTGHREARKKVIRCE